MAARPAPLEPKERQGGDIGGDGNLCVWPGSHLKTARLMRWPDGKIRRDGAAAVEFDTAGRDGTRTTAAAAAASGERGGGGGGEEGCGGGEEGYEDRDGALPDLGPPVT